ncbi:hypothetical protein [Tolumonas lignilytica]|uniref:hypothetical protein n=1 Tax=Tolumonas lignilytica TaxID=1283284 RepID=UPI0012696040|nr:hypothetical protein [Tolumonas lignilytica]
MIPTHRIKFTHLMYVMIAPVIILFCINIVISFLISQPTKDMLEVVSGKVHHIIDCEHLTHKYTKILVTTAEHQEKEIISRCEPELKNISENNEIKIKYANQFSFLLPKTTKVIYELSVNNQQIINYENVKERENRITNRNMLMTLLLVIIYLLFFTNRPKRLLNI